jgi:hypothetical protein
MIALIIYLIGYVWAYFITRKQGRAWAEYEEKEYGWIDIAGNLLFSLLSFIVVIGYYAHNPPKWL